MPSSSLVEVEVEVWVEIEFRVEVEVRVRGWGWTYFFGGVGGVSRWVVGELESKANLNSSCS